MEITKQKLEDREINIINIGIHLESGCDYREGEYSVFINSFVGSLNLNADGGTDDINKIKECIRENQDKIFDGVKGGYISLILEESGEWEDYSWLKYYELKRVVKCYLF